MAGDVFVIDAWPTDRGKWPAFLRDPDGETLLGYCFHEGRGNKVGPHGWRLPQDDDKAYYDALSKLAGSILKRLSARKPAKPAGAAVAVATGGRNVYLAWGTDDVARRRGELRELLRARGFTVLPDPEPAAPAELLARLAADLRGCKAFLQLLGGHGGRWDGDLAGPVAYQRARAEEAGIPILAWRNHRLPLEAVEDEAYRALLEQSSPADFAGGDQLADQVGGLVPLPTSGAPADDAPPAAYLTARAEAEPLRQELLDALLGPDLFVMPVFSDASVDLKDVDKAAQARLDSYVLCKALLLLRADGSPWIDQEILKFLTKDRIRLRKERNHELACAIVDRLGGSTALARRMGIEVFPWTDAASVEPIRSWLNGDAAALAEAAE